MRFAPHAALFPAMMLVAACSDTIASESALIADPFEPANRGIHAFNKGADTVILRPAAQAYGAVMPEPLERTVENFISNLSLPGDMVNNTLQGDTVALGDNLGRFLMNSTLGLGGLLDIASDAGVEQHPADFGQTLAQYGVGEGPYIELPLLGPSNARDATGTLFDMLTNPTGFAQGASTDDVLLGATVVGAIDTRDEFSGAIDGVLYESEDSYSSAKIAYIQARRAFVNGAGASDDNFVDIYAE